MGIGTRRCGDTRLTDHAQRHPCRPRQGLDLLDERGGLAPFRYEDLERATSTRTQ
jgi:hypothetical protein